MTKRTMTLVAVTMALASCGGGGGGGSSSDPGPLPEPTNVALADNGGVANASYLEETAGLVNDGDTQPYDGYYWQGNVQGDYVQITFDRAYTISEFAVYVNFTGNDNAGYTSYWLSEDGETFEPFAFTNDCNAATIGGGMITCEMKEPRIARAFRAQVEMESNAHNVHVSEIEVIGQ